MTTTPKNYGVKINISNYLRCIATLFVFLLHGRNYIPDLANANPLFRMLTYFPAWAGVWIFVFLSGYGIGIGFFTKRYNFDSKSFDLKSAVMFYLTRFFKIAPLYYIYCFLFEILHGNTFFYRNPGILLKILTFTFNGNGGVSGMGHLWYISLSMQLYLFMPLFYLILRKINSIRGLKITFLSICLSGLLLRLITHWIGVDWYINTYTNVFTNFDLTLCGMLTAQLNQKLTLSKPTKKSIQFGAVIFFATLVIYNQYLNFHGSANHVFIYRYILPTLYLIVCGNLMISWETHNRAIGVKHKIIMYINKFVNWFSKQSYCFYIFHIIVFDYLKSSILVSEFYLAQNPYVQYGIFFIIAFFITVLASYTLNTALNNIKIVSKGTLVVLCALLLGFSQSETLLAEDIYFSGSGTKDDPYLISSTDDLLQFAQNVNNGISYEDTYFIQTQNLDLEGIDWIPVGEYNSSNSFMGYYDGTGHYVSNLSIASNENAGFFGQLGGTVINFGIESGNISGVCIGSISSHSSNSSAQIINCYSKATLSGHRTGGIADNFNGTIANCWSMCQFTYDADGSFGGIVSYDATTIANCISISENPSSEVKTSDEITIINVKDYNAFDIAKTMNDFIVSSSVDVNINPTKFYVFQEEEHNIHFSSSKMKINIKDIPLLFFSSWYIIFPIIYAVLAIAFTFFCINHRINRSDYKNKEKR